MLFTVASVSISLLQILYFNLLPVGSTIGAFPATSGSVGDSFKSKKIFETQLVSIAQNKESIKGHKSQGIISSFNTKFSKPTT